MVATPEASELTSVISLPSTPSRVSDNGMTSSRSKYMTPSIPDTVGDEVVASPRKDNSVTEAIIYITKSCLRGAVAAVPESYKECGLWTAMLLNVFLGAAVTLSMYEMARSAQKMYSVVRVRYMSYPDLAEATLEFGPWRRLRDYSKYFRHVVEIVICTNLFGACCVYQVMMARTLMQFVQGKESIVGEGAHNIRIYILCLLLPCIIISLITNLKYLAPFAVTADLCIYMITAATVYYGSESSTADPQTMPIFNSVSGVFEFMGVCVFTMEGMEVTLAMGNNMVTPKALPLVLIAGMALVTIFVMTIGFFGYWGFGEMCNSPVTINFPLYSFPVTIKMFFLLMMYITFGLTFYVPFNIVWSYLSCWHSYTRLGLWERLYRVLCVLMITGVAVAMPTVAKFIAVLGAVCVSHIGFIFPAFISLTIEWEERDRKWWRGCKTVILVSLGLVLCVPAAASNAGELINELYFKKGN